MKRFLSFIICVVMILTLSACNTTTTVDATTVSSLTYVGDRNLKSKFESYASAKDILSNISNIDLSQEMGSVSGYELVTQSSDNSSSIDVYYRNEERIYEVYNGYSDNLWKFYTTGVDGTKLVVSFWDENDARNVKIELVDKNVKVPYVIYFYGVDKEYSLGAKKVTVEISPENSTYAMTATDSSYYISSATYWDENSELHKFEADYDSESKSVNYHTDNIVISHDIPTVDVGQDYVLAAGLRSEGLAETAILIGKHTVYKNADDNFFVNADTTLVFKDSDSANTALGRLKMITVKSNDFTVKQDSTGNYYLIDIGACNYGLSETYTDGKNELIKYAVNDFDDYVYKSITLDENLNISAIKDSGVRY